jgi:hypothetical protein
MRIYIGSKDGTVTGVHPCTTMKCLNHDVGEYMEIKTILVLRVIKVNPPTLRT